MTRLARVALAAAALVALGAGCIENVTLVPRSDAGAPDAAAPSDARSPADLAGSDDLRTDQDDHDASVEEGGDHPEPDLSSPADLDDNQGDR